MLFFLLIINQFIFLFSSSFFTTQHYISNGILSSSFVVVFLLFFCFPLDSTSFFTFTLSLTCWLLIKQDVHTNALLTFTMSYLLSRLFLTFTVEHNKIEEKKVYNKYISIIISTILNFRRNHNHKSNWMHWKIERKQREAVFPLFEIIFQRIFLFSWKKVVHADKNRGKKLSCYRSRHCNNDK